LIELTFQVTSRTGGSLVLPNDAIGDRSGPVLVELQTALRAPGQSV